MSISFQRQNITATGWLVCLNVAVYLVLLLVDAVAPRAALLSWLALPSTFPLFLHKPWTLLTYMFTQDHLWHLLVNMLWLFMFGRIMAIVMDHWRVVSVYITGGIAGGLLYLLVGMVYPTGTTGLLCGSSASVLAIMCAAGMKMPHMKVNLFLFGSVRLKWVVIVSVAILLMCGGSGFFAHLGGCVAGLFMKNGGPSLLPLIKRVGGVGERLRQRRRMKAVRRKMTRLRNDNERLNQLLDKVKVSGYDSLSPGEKNELKRLSQSLKNFNSKQ